MGMGGGGIQQINKQQKSEFPTVVITTKKIKQE